MADHTIPPGGNGLHALALTANTELSVEFSDDVPAVRIFNHSGNAILYCTVDNSPPIVGQAWAVPAAITSRRFEPPTAGNTIVRLISAQAGTVGVERA